MGAQVTGMTYTQMPHELLLLLAIFSPETHGKITVPKRLSWVETIPKLQVRSETANVQASRFFHGQDSKNTFWK